MSNLIHKTFEAIDMIADKLNQNAGELGIAYVGKYDEKRIPKYPAVVIVPGPREKSIHGTQTFEILLTAELYVYHANLTLSKRERSKEDLKLVADLEAILESDYLWKTDPNDPQSGRLIFGYISGERPGALQPSASKSTIVIGTRMSWRGLSQRRFHPV